MNRFIKSYEMHVLLGLLAISIAFLVAAWRLPEGVFDPLGPGSVPEMVAGTLIILCLIELARVLRRPPNNRDRRDVPADVLAQSAPPSSKAFASFAALLLLYILAFQLQLGHFILLTTGFLFAATISLRGWDARTAVAALILAATLSVVLFYVLTKFFVIRLPGAF